jgi:NAD(P)-dependent dehydrogenase (short-subunit alcohol dehydrogenase family)
MNLSGQRVAREMLRRSRALLKRCPTEFVPEIAVIETYAGVESLLRCVLVQAKETIMPASPTPALIIGASRGLGLALALA